MNAAFARRAAALLLLCGLASPAWAGIDEWTRIGPGIGNVCALAAAPSRPSTVYAGMLETGDLFQSLDGGRTWTLVHDGSRRDSRFSNVCMLAVDPRAPETIYVSPRGTGALSRSTDGGRTWSQIFLPPIGGPILFLKHHPTRSDMLYLSLQGGPVLRITNDGRTWSALSSPSPRWVTALAVHPGQPDTLYAGNGLGFFRSTDGGATWATLRPAPGAEPAEILIDPRNPRTIFLRTTHGRILRSTHGGSGWVQLNMAPRALVRELALEPGRQPTLYAAVDGNRIFRSTDGGSTWRPFRGPSTFYPLQATDLLVLPDALLAGTLANGIFRSEDGAVTWSPSSHGLVGGSIVDLDLNPRNPAILYAFTFDAGIFRTRNGGGNWTRLNVDPGFPSLAKGLVHPLAPANVYMVQHNRLVRSTDAGASWTPLPGPACTLLRWIEADPRQSSTIYTGGDLSGPSCACAVWKSADRGATWSCIGHGLPQASASAFAVDPLDPSTLHAISSQHLHRSDDGGTTWTKVSDLLIFEPNLAIDPLNPAILYAGTREGVARTADRGQTWEVRGQGLPSGSFVHQVEIDPTRTTVLYAVVRTPASLGHGIYVSTDSGATWTPHGPELNEEMFIRDLVIDPLDPSMLYIATVDYGVMKLTQEAP